jgi:hypothetical protein
MKHVSLTISMTQQQLHIMFTTLFGYIHPCDIHSFQRVNKGLSTYFHENAIFIQSKVWNNLPHFTIANRENDNTTWCIKSDGYEMVFECSDDIVRFLREINAFKPRVTVNLEFQGMITPRSFSGTFALYTMNCKLYKSLAKAFENFISILKEMECGGDGDNSDGDDDYEDGRRHYDYSLYYIIQSSFVYDELRGKYEQYPAQIGSYKQRPSIPSAPHMI